MVLATRAPTLLSLSSLLPPLLLLATASVRAPLPAQEAPHAKPQQMSVWELAALETNSVQYTNHSAAEVDDEAVAMLEAMSDMLSTETPATGSTVALPSSPCLS